MKIHRPETIQEAIDDLQTFLECDLWSKFYPEERIPTTIKGKKKILKLYRTDVFRNEDDFYNYLNRHLNVLRDEIKRILKKNKQMKLYSHKRTVKLKNRRIKENGGNKRTAN